MHLKFPKAFILYKFSRLSQLHGKCINWWYMYEMTGDRRSGARACAWAVKCAPGRRCMRTEVRLWANIMSGDKRYSRAKSPYTAVKMRCCQFWQPRY